MKTNDIMKNATLTVNRVALKVKKHSPEILLVVGVVGMIGTVVSASIASTKLSEIITEVKDTFEKIEETTKNADISDYTEEDAKNDKRIVCTKAGVKLVKLYGPSVLLGTVSIICILSSNHILRERNVALAAAYTTVDRGFKEYRERVIDRFGEEVDKELKYNIRKEKVEETETDENGKEKKVKKTVDVADINGYSPYAKFFDESCDGWTKDAEFNLMTVRRVQNFANEKLHTQGHMFLNEVYDMLGIDRTRDGNIVGWLYDPENPNLNNVIDFGIYDVHKKGSRNFVNGFERTILLDFNVDGNILDLI